MKRINDMAMAKKILAMMMSQTKDIYKEAYSPIWQDGEIIIVENDKLRDFPRIPSVIFEGNWYSVLFVEGKDCLDKAIFEVGTPDFYVRLRNEFNRLGRLKQYRSIIGYEGPLKNYTMQKTWNRGMGILELWDINIKSETILINTALFNNADKAHLKSLIDAVPEIKGYKVEGVCYGYPLYYNYGFLSSRLPAQRKPLSLD